MDNKINTLKENHARNTPLPETRTKTKWGWVYPLKEGKNCWEVQYKARFVACSYSQIDGIDYDETVSPIAGQIHINSHAITKKD